MSEHSGRFDDAIQAASPYELTLLDHFNRTQRLSQTGSWVAHIRNGALQWSAQTYRIYGVTPETYRPSLDTLLDRVHPADRERMREAYHRALAGGEPFALDHRILLPEGGVRTVAERAEVDFDANGKPLRMIGAIQDVTSIRAAEAAARGSEQMLAAMLRISPEAIVVADAQGRVLDFSAGAEAIFGYTAEEVIGGSVERLFPARYHRDHRRHVAEFAAGRSPSLRMHDRGAIVGQRKSGEEFPAEASLARLETAHGYAFTAIVRDLSERQATEQRLIEAREQAEKANLAKSTFLANMSHEIRTPLNGVLGVVGALARTGLNAKQMKMVGLIESSGRALERLLSDILDLAKVDAGRMSVRIEPFDLGAVVRDTVELFHASAAEKGVQLKVDLPPEADGRFAGDDLKIRQVLSNLLSNAVKFTQKGSVRLSVTVTHDPDADAARVRFVVRDTGVGFSPEAAANLFERFEQADGSVTRRFGGTGLGLAISKAMVTLMGGTISATAAPGRGATFRFEVSLKPLADRAPAAPAAPASDPGGQMRPLRVLLAEDHVVNRMTVELILEHLPIELVCVEDGAQAVEAFETGAFDLVLMDMQMPVMDGLAAIRRIRALEAETGRPHTPICVLTANAMTEHREAAEAAGADFFVTKPMNAQALIDVVVRAAAGTGSAAQSAA